MFVFRKKKRQAQEMDLEELKPCYFHEVPNEIKRLIFLYLNCDDLIRVSLVCKNFFNIVHEQLLFRPTFNVVKPKGTPPDPRVCHAGIVFGNTLLVHGGHFPAPPHFYISNVKNDLHEFNFITKSWTEIKGNFPSRTEHTFVQHGSYFYLFGGYGPHSYSNALFRFDPVRKSFMEIPTTGQPPSPRSAHSSSVHGNKMYIYGGWSGEKSHNDFFVLNFDTLVWEQREVRGITLPALRSHNSVIYENCLYIFGGYGEEEGHPEALYEYNLENDFWSKTKTRGDIPCGRSRGRIVVFENKMFLLGGWDRKVYFNDMYEYSFERKTWKKIVTLPESLGQHLFVSYEGYLYQFGGFLGICQQPSALLQNCRLRLQA